MGGLRYFDVVIILTASRYTETEIMIGQELQQFGVPHFMVRSKVDVDIVNNEDDHDMSEQATLDSIRTSMQREGVVKPYLISGKFTKRANFDMEVLTSDAFVAVARARDVSSDWWQRG